MKKPIKTPKTLKVADPIIIPRAEHTISRKDICEHTLKVLYRLHKHGYEAYLVGGGVRDLLLGMHPKDFDVATNARPEEIRSVFSNSRIIGKRFRLVHVFYGYDIIEVATFRQAQLETKSKAHQSEEGMLLRDNVFGTLVEDAFRRDFTINALYYNIDDFSIVDYVGGLSDLNAKIIRMIGDPKVRYREDPVRILRALRFAAKLGFEIEPVTKEPIAEMSSLLDNIPAARLYEECQKMFLTGHALASLNILIEYKLLGCLLPTTASYIASGHDGEENHTYQFLKVLCESTDERFKNDQSLGMPFLLAAFLWDPFVDGVRYFVENNRNNAHFKSSEEVLSWQHDQTTIPRYAQGIIRDIWYAQYKIVELSKVNVQKIMQESCFNAAYDFLLLRARSGENVQEVAAWWTAYLAANQSTRDKMLKALPDKTKKSPKKKKASPSKLKTSKVNNSDTIDESVELDASLPVLNDILDESDKT